MASLNSRHTRIRAPISSNKEPRRPPGAAGWQHHPPEARTTAPPSEPSLATRLLVALRCPSVDGVSTLKPHPFPLRKTTLNHRNAIQSKQYLAQGCVSSCPQSTLGLTRPWWPLLETLAPEPATPKNGWLPVFAPDRFPSNWSGKYTDSLVLRRGTYVACGEGPGELKRAQYSHRLVFGLCIHIASVDSSKLSCQFGLFSGGRRNGCMQLERVTACAMNSQRKRHRCISCAYEGCPRPHDLNLQRQRVRWTVLFDQLRNLYGFV